MSEDISVFKNFLLSGALIFVDARTANAICLKNNLKRDWDYYKKFDQHFLELKEVPLRLSNVRQTLFCLGSEWLGGIW